MQAYFWSFTFTSGKHRLILPFIHSEWESKDITPGLKNPAYSDVNTTYKTWMPE